MSENTENTTQLGINPETKPTELAIDKIIGLAREFESNGGSFGFTGVENRIARLPSGDEILLVRTNHSGSVDNLGNIMSSGFGNCVGVLVSSPDRIDMNHTFGGTLYKGVGFATELLESDKNKKVVLISKNFNDLVEMADDICARSAVDTDDITMVYVDRNQFYDNRETYRIWAGISDKNISYRITSDNKVNKKLKTTIQTLKQFKDSLPAK